MRTAVEVVATEPEPASSERRSASIAAAMAAATPASPEVTSLAAARHERAEKQRSIPRGLIAAVAAAVALIVAIPIALSLGGGDTTDFASEAASTAADETASADVEASADAAVDDVEEEAMEDEEEAMEDEEEAMEDEEEAMEDEEEVVDLGQDAEADSGDIVDSAALDPEVDDELIVLDPIDVEDFELSDLPSATTATLLDQAISDGEIAPFYSAEEVIVAGVQPSCIAASDNLLGDSPYALAALETFGGADRLVVIEFTNNGQTRALDAEDCSLLG